MVTWPRDILEDEIELLDTLGGRMKVSLQGGGWHWYAQGGYQGLVADGGEDRTVTFTGWKLKQAGRGNHWGAVTGLAYNFGKFQIAPAFLYQRPLEGPLPLLGDFYAADTNIYYPGVRPRNVLDDPFAVLGNREQTAFELMFSYDQTPGTWMWAWDNEKVENANFAMSLNFVYRMLPTSRDSAVAVFDGFGLAAFGKAPPANDVWEAHASFISNPGYDLRLVGNLWAGENQANGADERLVMRYGGNLRLTWRKLAFATEVKIDDWGPYDYHRDFNLTFPFQWTGDLSWALVSPKWLGGMWTKFGVRAQFRTLDEFSPRVLLDSDGMGQVH